MNTELPDIDRRFLIAGFAVIGLMLVGFIGSNVLQPSMQENVNHQSTTSYGQPDLAMDARGVAPTASGDSAESSSSDRRKATTVYVDFKVASVEQAMEDAEGLSQEFGGIVDRSSFNRQYGSTGSMTVRVPQENISAFMTSVEQRWEVDSKTTDTEDVTDQYSELELELENRQQELNRLEELVNQTDEVEDLIKIQERMSVVRSRIEYIQQRLDDLDRRTEYTRVNLNFEQHESFSSEFELREAFATAYRGIFDSVRLLIVGAGYLLPFAVIYGIYRGGRRLRERL